MIKIGIFLNTNYGAGENVAVRFREAAEQVRMARDYGFASVCVGQHFLTEYQKLQPIPVLARLAADSGDMRLLPGIVLLPLFNPVYVAEEIATLDVVSGGPAQMVVRLHDGTSMRLPRAETCISRVVSRWATWC